jgi:hypothetical protein
MDEVTANVFAITYLIQLLTAEVLAVLTAEVLAVLTVEALAVLTVGTRPNFKNKRIGQEEDSV